MVRLSCFKVETKRGPVVHLRCSCGFDSLIPMMHEHLTVDHTYPSGVAMIAIYYTLNKNKEIEQYLWEFLDD